jgi:hypothetical protein
LAILPKNANLYLAWNFGTASRCRRHLVVRVEFFLQGVRSGVFLPTSLQSAVRQARTVQVNTPGAEVQIVHAGRRAAPASHVDLRV